MVDKETAPRPWYKEPYVWMILAFPFSAMVVGFTMLRISWVTFDGLVVDDYYKRGLEINRSFERDKTALKYGLEGYLQANTNGALRLFLKSKENYTLPLQLKINFLHRTRKGFDQSVILQRQADVYVGNIAPLIDGLWEIIVEGQDWRLDAMINGKVSEVKFAASDNFYKTTPSHHKF